MKKIVMHAINSSWSHSCLSFYYLSSAIRDLPFEIIHSSSTLKDDALELLESLAGEQPEILCLSVYIWNRVYTESLLHPLLRLLPHCIIVLGGPEAPQLDLNRLRDDFGRRRIVRVSGPGEKAFRLLAEQDFETDEPELHAVNYLLSELDFPYSEADLQSLEGKLLYYETSRGCPYGCIYCLSSRDCRNDKRFDLSKPEETERLRNELDKLLAAKPKTLKFVDRSFNTDKVLAHLVWKHLLDHPELSVCHFEIYPDLLTEADIELLRQAPEGRFRFEIGIQSTNSAVLKRCGRNMNWPHAKNMLLKLRSETQVLCHCDLLIGLPGESYASVIQSLDEVMELRPHELQLGTLKVLPDTPMLELAGKLGYLWQQNPPYMVLSTDALSFTELCRLDHLAHIINLYWNKGEERELWQQALIHRKASELFLELMELHVERGIQFHSVAAKRRVEILREVLALS